jgi:predicted ATPase/DNA-binding CsgD family transcriptional regulator
LNHNNIPVPLTSLVGRQKEVDEVGRLLSTSRVLTLLGPGGVGKTRLAIEVANAVASKFLNGVCWVDIASLADPELIPQTIAKALDIYLAPYQAPLEAIENYLQSQDLLLVLDNCEHLIARVSKLVENLLRICPKLNVLTASRDELGIYGEVTWRVPSLAIPDIDLIAPLQSLAEYPSVQLFVERGAAVLPGYSLTEFNYQPIALICRRLDGLPLAIELAAVRIKMLSANEIAARLDDRFELLTGGSRNALPRQQTLRATLDWSYDLLSEAEQKLFRSLSVFADYFSLQAAEKVAYSNLPSPEEVNFLDLFEQLVNKSLIKAEIELPAFKSRTRYQMQETIREYAREKLLINGETVAVHAAYLAYYLSLVSQAEPNLYNQEQSLWSDRLEAEYDNLRAAIEWSIGNHQIESAARLALDIAHFWQIRGYYCEAAMWLDRILAFQGITDQPRAKLLLVRGQIAQAQGEYEQATAFVDSSLAIFRPLGDISGIAQGNALMGIIRVLQGERGQGIDFLEESLRTFKESGEEWQAARALLYISDSYNRMGNNEKASQLSHECLSLFTKLGDEWGIAFASGNAGEIARQQGDFKQAKKYFRNNLIYHWQQGQKGDIPYPLETLSLIAISEESYAHAIRLWGAAEVFREKANTPLPPAYQNDYQKYLTLAREKLGENAYLTYLQEGRELSAVDVINLAIHEDPIQVKASPVADSEPMEEFHLTKREIEILRLVATGMTDAQVAKQLFLSPRTISKHLESIYSKLNVNSRTAATHIALSHKMIDE